MWIKLNIWLVLIVDRRPLSNCMVHTRAPEIVHDSFHALAHELFNALCSGIDLAGTSFAFRWFMQLYSPSFGIFRGWMCECVRFGGRNARETYAISNAKIINMLRMKADLIAMWFRISCGIPKSNICRRIHNSVLVCSVHDVLSIRSTPIE